jgi:hypothetical protein
MFLVVYATYNGKGAVLHKDWILPTKDNPVMVDSTQMSYYNPDIEAPAEEYQKMRYTRDFRESTGFAKFTVHKICGKNEKKKYL